MSNTTQGRTKVAGDQNTKLGMHGRAGTSKSKVKEAVNPRPPLPNQRCRRQCSEPDGSRALSCTSYGRLKSSLRVEALELAGRRRPPMRREGFDGAISYLSSEQVDANEVIALIEVEGAKALAMPGDIKDEEWCQSIVLQIIDAFGGLDILVITPHGRSSVKMCSRFARRTSMPP